MHGAGRAADLVLSAQLMDWKQLHARDVWRSDGSSPFRVLAWRSEVISEVWRGV